MYVQYIPARSPLTPPLPLQTELIMNTHTIAADMRRDMLKSREDTDGQSLEASDRDTIRYRMNADHRPDSKQVSVLDYQGI